MCGSAAFGKILRRRICKKPLTKVDYLQAIEDAAVPIPLIEAGDDEGMPDPPENDGADNGQTDVRYFLSEEAAAGRESLLTAVGSQIFLTEVRYFSRKSDTPG